MHIFLEIFLLLDVFVMGALAATALRHAYAHFRPHTHAATERPHPAEGGHLPPALRQQLLEAAQADFQTVLKHSAAELAKDLETTAAEIKKQLEHQGTETLRQELERYRARLAELQRQTETDMTGAQAALDTHQTELKAKMATEVAAEKQRLLQQIDTKLADAVAAFLLETLQHNVDLGAQSAYLTGMLEEHKADFAKEISDEA